MTDDTTDAPDARTPVQIEIEALKEELASTPAGTQEEAEAVSRLNLIMSVLALPSRTAEEWRVTEGW